MRRQGTFVDILYIFIGDGNLMLTQITEKHADASQGTIIASFFMNTKLRGSRTMAKKTRNTTARVAAAAGMALAACAANANFVDGPEGFGDRVWVDADMDGIQDDSEAGLANVVVSLLEGDETPIGSTTTDALGNYMFYFNSDELGIHTFKIKFELPDGYLFTLQDVVGDDTIDSDADPTTGITDFLYTCYQCVDSSIDAGMYMSPIPVPAAVWLFGSGLLGLIGIAKRKPIKV